MDYSAVAEAQQQQHQQQQQQTDQQQPYDASQAQAYAAYYAAYNQYYAQSGYYHQPYYPHEYSSSSAAAPAGAYYAEAQPESAIPPSDASQIHYSGTHTAAYAPGTVYPPGTAYAPATAYAAPTTGQDGYSYQAPQGLNPAAVAALSQLSQLSGTIDAAERAMAGMQDRQPQSHYPHYSQMPQAASSNRPGVGGMTHRSGGGRRDGGPFRGSGGPSRGGGNRGSYIGPQPSRRDGGGPPSSRGRGNGRMSRSRGRRPQFSAPDSQQRSSAVSNTSDPSTGQAQRSLFPIAWCDVCRVDCNSFEILEQHKSGKRHKKTLQRVLDMQARQNVISSELQYNAASQPLIFGQGEDLPLIANDGDGSMHTMNVSIPSSGHMQALGEAVEANIATENNPIPEFVTKQETEHPDQSQPVSDGPKDEGPVPDASQDETLSMEGHGKKRRMGSHDRNDRWRSSRPRMMRGGRGGRHPRSSEGRSLDRPKGPRERPRVCTICSITCDTMAVFECHLSGKKHLARIKRFERQGSVFGPIAVYIPPNQPTRIPNRGPEPMFYGLQSLEALQQQSELQIQGMLHPGDHGLDGPQLENAAGHQLQHFEAEGAAPESMLVQSSGHPDEPPVPTDEQVAVIPDPDNSAPTEFHSDVPIGEVATLPDSGAPVGTDVSIPGADAASGPPPTNSELQ